MFSSNTAPEKPASYYQESTFEKISPSDWIKESQIKVYDNRIIIDLENAEWAKFTDTNSMDPVIDSNANAIEIVPKSYKEIQPGDIVSYEIENVEGIIIHRVVETGFDEKGWFAVTKGDNLENNDPFKIRFSNIKRVVVAIIY
jgi:signal peptidase I